MNYTFKNPKEMGIYVQTSNYKTITQLQKSLGVDVICNFRMFTIATKEANYILKVNGELIEEATMEKVVAKIREVIAKEEEEQC